MALSAAYFNELGFHKKQVFLERLNNRNLLTLYRQLGLLKPNKTCPNCNVQMVDERKQRSKFGYIFRCNLCRNASAVTEGSIFENRRIDAKIFLGISFLFCRKLNIDKAFEMYEGAVTRNAIEKGYAICADMCILKLRTMHRYFSFGGPGQSVQLDESCFCKRKNNVGRLLHGQHEWVLGIVEVASRKLFLKLVPNRTAAVMLPVIRRRVRRRTRVTTDLYPPYMHLGAMGYIHRTVNHSVNFVDPNTGANTNLIEGMWSVVKRLLRSMFLMGSPNIRRNLDLAMYFLAFKVNTYRNFLTHIQEIYNF